MPNIVLTLILTTLLSAALAGVVVFIFKRWPILAKNLGNCSLGISGISAIIAGIKAVMTATPLIYAINSGFPNITFLFKLDPLAGFFFAILGIVVVSVAVYAPGYLRSYDKKHSITDMMFFTGLFIAAMYLVLLASDVFSFMFAWELMSLSSFFLVAYHHEHAANRSAAFVYLVMAHASGLLILGAFGVLAIGSANFDFTTLAQANLTPTSASCAFLLALLGFGMKAGIVPLHVWLPRAHPVAPSHISALMSGVMLKIAVYGLMRFSFGLLHTLHWQWGMIVLIIGTISALLGVLYALMQHDIKKLLAYHSVENIGIIFMGIGLAIIFLATMHPILGALAFIAALYHSLNHALFKSLLFLGAGAILQHSHEQDLEKMGGLIHRMPHTALFFLIGCISISALPPFNGFVSEWLTFQASLQATVLQSPFLRILIPVAAALLALTGALAAACFVKVYGVAFLGQPRNRHVKHARDPAFGMRLAMGFLAILCLLFGILPTLVMNHINLIPQYLLGTGLPTTNHWLWLVPLSPHTASYSALLVGGTILLIWLMSFLVLRTKIATQRVKPWDCGFGGLNSRMQYTATAFSMPIRRVFRGAWPISETETVERAKHAPDMTYKLTVEDLIWKYCFEPLEHISLMISRRFALLQGGNVRIYLVYAFVTLLILLWVVS